MSNVKCNKVNSLFLNRNRPSYHIGIDKFRMHSLCSQQNWGKLEFFSAWGNSILFFCEISIFTPTVAYFRCKFPKHYKTNIVSSFSEIFIVSFEILLEAGTIKMGYVN